MDNIYGEQPYWITDIPPCYDVVVGCLPEPPPYRSIHDLPPSYYAEDDSSTLPVFVTSQSKLFTDVTIKINSEEDGTPSDTSENIQ